MKDLKWIMFGIGGLMWGIGLLMQFDSQVLKDICFYGGLCIAAMGTGLFYATIPENL